MRSSRFLIFALPMAACAQQQEKTCSAGFALANDGNCYEVAPGEGGDTLINGWSSPIGGDPGNDANFGACGTAEHYYDNKRHTGADYGSTYGMGIGSPVYAISDGEVKYVFGASSAGTGNVALLVLHETGDGEQFVAVYGHIAADRAVDADYADDYVPDGNGAVTNGQVLGYVGDYSGGPHLHFGVRPGDELPLDGWGRVADVGCTLDPNDPAQMNGFVAPYTYLMSNPAPGSETTLDGYLSTVSLQGSELSLGGKVWARDGVSRMSVTVGDDTSSSDPTMYCEDANGDADCDSLDGTSTEVYFDTVIDLSATDLQSGTYTAGLWVVDNNGASAKVDEEGDFTYDASSGSGSGGGTPNLRVGNPLATSYSPDAGDTVRLSGTVENTGDGTVASFAMAAYLSTDSVASAGDVQLTSWNQGTGSYTADVTIPTSASGAYYLLVVADPDHELPETDETDNTGSRAVTVTGSSTTTNLEVDAPVVSDYTPSAGDELTVSGSVENGGSGDSGQFAMAAYLSSNASWSSSSDTLLHSWTQDSIASGGTGRYSEPVSLPSSISSGSYYVIVVADPDGALPETSDADNTGTSASLDVAAASTSVNLSVGTPSVSDRSVTAGDAITLTGDISNSGTSASGSFTAAAYLSTNTSWSSSADTLLSSWPESLGAGDTDSYAEGVTIPSSTPAGTYYVIVVADPSDAVAETSSSDNASSSSSVTVTSSCTASDYWTPASISASDVGARADGSSYYGVSDGVTLSAEIEDAGSGNVKFRVCKASGNFSGADIWVAFDETALGMGVMYEAAVATSSSSSCTGWTTLDASSWAEGEDFGGNMHVESPSASGTTWGSGCSDDGSTSGDCWYFNGFGTMERTCL